VWDWAIWGALIVGGGVVVAGLVLLAVGALRAWRDFKRLRRHVAKALGALAAAGERTAELAAAASDTAEVERSLARLRGSLAQLAVLRREIDDVQDAGPRILWAFVRR
jgi:ubiquinone biosynthesis protein UbiJ